MPGVASLYPFEFAIFQWARDFGRRLCGAGDHAFLLLFDERGSARFAAFYPVSDSDRVEAARQLMARHQAWLWFDPFDLPEDAWVEWHGLGQATVERLLGERWGPDALTPPWGGETLAFPSSWSIRF